VWSNALAGSALAGAALGAASAVAFSLVFSLYYVGGMYLNDAFDRHFDRRERPERPIPSGAVSAMTVFMLGFSMLGAGVLGTFWLAHAARLASTDGAVVSGLVLAGLVILYDAYHKQNPLSPLLMGLCRVMVYVTAALAAADQTTASLWLGALALLCHLIGLTYAAKQENLAALQGVWPLGFLALPAVYGLVLSLRQPLVIAPLLAYVGYSLHALRFLMPGPKRSIPGAVVRLIAAISLLDAVLLTSMGQSELGLVAVALCGLTRLGQRYVPGT